MINKVLRIGDDFNMVASDNCESAGIYSVRNVMNLTALNLADDIGRYRQGETSLTEQIVLETNALNALAAATNAMK